MVEGRKSTTLQKLTRWSAAAVSPNSSIPNWPDNRKFNMGYNANNNNMETNTFQPIDHDDLVQGSLYILKVKIVTIGLFEGWNDDMCCFSVLRSDTGSMRWSEARYLPGDFDAYDAFDEAGNPPVYFWTRFLRIQVPLNWFSLFEEARRRQRAWTVDLQQYYIYENEDQDLTAFPVPPSPVPSISHYHQHQQPNIDKSLNNNKMDTTFTQMRHSASNKDLNDHPLPPPPIPSTTKSINEIPRKASFTSLQQHQDATGTPTHDHIVYSPVPSFKHTQRKQQSPLPLRRPSSPPSITSFHTTDPQDNTSLHHHHSMERNLSSNTIQSNHTTNNNNNNTNRSISEKSVHSKRKSILKIF